MRRVDPYSLAALGFAAIGILGIIALASSAVPSAPIVDVQAEAADAIYTRGSVKGQLKRARTRDPSKIRGIMLHQVGVANVGDGAWKKMSYHYGVTKDGRIYKIHPLDIKLLHGHGLNTTTVAVAIEGNYGPGDEMPAAQARALRAAIALAHDEILATGGTPEAIFAHRQTHESRGRDPSEDAWQEGALWARDALGMKIPEDFKHGSGRTIPDRWMEPDENDLRLA